MSNARAGHTATLLRDGRVLLLGGGQLDVDDLLISITAAEIFLPSTSTFAVAGMPCVAREFHTATLLGNGKVLITGGRIFTGYPTWLLATASAELYDPASDSFTPTGAMAVPRARHTASLLPDGQVLIVGGDATGSSGAELYDPIAGTFRVVRGAALTRVGHTATPLAAGKILIAGGQGAEDSDVSAVTGAAEIYDPGTRTFTAVGSMAAPRTGHTASLLANGKVLVAGGASTPALAIGSLRGGTVPLQSAELYDPATAAFTAVAPMATGHIGHAASVLRDGTIAIFGGFKTLLGSQPSYLGYLGYDSVEIFDPVTSTFIAAGPMPATRFWHSATLLPDGAVLLAGGIGGDRILPSSTVPAGTLTSAELFR
ncbi:MAG: kelch repeat-containing protein [Steroidobacteraceae bacterium]